MRGNHNLNLNFSNQKAFLGSSYEADVYYQSVDNVFFYSPVFVGGGQSMVSSDKKGLRFFINTPLLTSKKVSGDISYGLDLMNDIFIANEKDSGGQHLYTKTERTLPGRIIVPNSAACLCSGWLLLLIPPVLMFGLIFTKKILKKVLK